MKRKHQLTNRPYFRVTGPRLEFVMNELRGEMVSTGNVLPPRVRFEALRLSDVENFAHGVYEREAIICEIHEVPR